MKACPFCQRIREWDFIDTGIPHVARFEPLNPVALGHMLFVPDRHVMSARYDSATTGECMRAAARYASRQQEDFNLITSSGHSATQTVPHLHVHYVPRREGDGLALPWTGQR
jgi:histidine triad (HIT) family protein